jgi:hypothetical protein
MHYNLLKDVKIHNGVGHGRQRDLGSREVQQDTPEKMLGV